MTRRALIVGASGQDGKLLAEFLKKKDYKVDGLGKGSIDLLDQTSVEGVVSKKYNEIYYLAAFHHSAESIPLDKEVLFKLSHDINCKGPFHFLSSISSLSPGTKFFYASSSHIYDGLEEPQTETSPVNPDSSYAATKIEGMKICAEFRARNIFASVGILYNHESPFRSPIFVSRKVTQGVAKIFLGQESKLELGSLDVEIDWGYAGDYVEAMWRILQLPMPDNFIVSTGQLRTLREFAEIAFSSVGLNYRDYIVLKPDLMKKKNVRRVGNSRKLKEATGWSPRTSFEEMIHLMVREDIKALKNE